MILKNVILYKINNKFIWSSRALNAIFFDKRLVENEKKCSA